MLKTSNKRGRRTQTRRVKNAGKEDDERRADARRTGQRTK